MAHFGRRALLKVMSGLAAEGPLEALTSLLERASQGEHHMSAPPDHRQPVLFVGHGSPMNAIEENRFSQGFRRLAGLLPRPRAILAVSAHWYGEGLHLTSQRTPPTIHDFSGFPEPLYRVRYPAPGSPELAERVVALLGPRGATLRDDWGLDHGTWSVLVHLRPAADVPVVQLSLDATLSPAQHLEAARALAPLRDEGVLILASGNVTHNLRHALSAAATGNLTTPPWAAAFDADVARAVEQRDHAWLTGALATEAGRASHPWPDHYLPILYAVGASDPAEPVQFPVTGFDLASLSMRSFLIGTAAKA
jgi:4,5-DOPA dioxygenase extradiol